jgi:hypothetical protein
MSMLLPWKSVLRSLCAAVLAGGLGLACSATPGSSQTVIAAQPSYEQFAGAGQLAPGVHVFLENQCGGLDCHGQVGRPLRLYSTNGLRLPNDAGLSPGTGLVSTDEIFANFSATINIEPAEMSRVVAGLDPPTQLLLVKKPLGLERHKGGTRIVVNDDMYKCLTGWLMDPAMPGSFNQAACMNAAALQ